MSKKKMREDLKTIHTMYGHRANQILNIIARFRYNDDCIDCLYEKIRDELYCFDNTLMCEVSEWEESYNELKIEE